jgi:ribosomal protein S19E (S16A)
MYQPALTQGEKIAMRRIAAGSLVDSNMWADLSRKGLVERRSRGRVLTAKGREALGGML